MWDTKRIAKEIKSGEPMIYFDDGRWFCVYRPSDKHEMIYSLGMTEHDDAAKWGRLRVAEWSEYLSKEV